MALKNYGYFDLGNGDIEEGQIDERQSPIAPVSQFIIGNGISTDSKPNSRK
jgi:hypothetical protein